MRHGNTQYEVIPPVIDGNSDPTYEAWKHAGVERKKRYEGNSDPTYEAWKRVCNVKATLKLVNTPILPMRHGNFTFVILSSSETLTPILPMRHGN